MNHDNLWKKHQSEDESDCEDVLNENPLGDTVEIDERLRTKKIKM